MNLGDVLKLGKVDAGFMIKALSVWELFEKTDTASLDAQSVTALFERFGHALPLEQAQAIEELVAGTEPGTVVSKFIMDGSLTNALTRMRNGIKYGEEPVAALTRCPFCSNLHAV